MSDLMALPFAQAIWQASQILLITVGFFALYWLLAKMIEWVERQCLRVVGIAAADDHAIMQAIREETRILDARFFGLVFNLVKITLALVLLILYLPVGFTIFPATGKLGSVVLDAILEPLSSAGRAFLGYLPSLVEIVVIVLITYYLLRIGRFVARKTADGTFAFEDFYADWAYAHVQHR